MFSLKGRYVTSERDDDDDDDDGASATGPLGGRSSSHTHTDGLLTISTERPCYYEELTVMFTQHKVIISK